KAYVERDVCDRDCTVGEQLRSAAQASADQILMRGHSDYPGEQPQEMKRAEPRFPGNLLQIERLLRVCVDPQRSMYRAAPIPRRRRERPTLAFFPHFDIARRERQSNFIEAYIALA